jgi:hypothetical protein
MNRGPTLLARILRRPLVLVKFAVTTLYGIFFAWWLDKLIVRRSNKQFSADIRTYLAFLFERYRARVLPNDREPPPSFDWALVTVSINNVILQFFRDRGTVTVRVTPSASPYASYELLTLLNAMDMEVARRPFDHLIDIEPLLRRHIEDIQNAFSQENYPHISEQLASIARHDEAIRLQWERDLNRRLYDGD